MSEDNKVAELIGMVDRADQDLSNLKNRWMNYYKLYRNWRDQSNIKGRSNVGIPLAFEWVEVVKSRLFDIFFGKRPYVRTKGQEPSDDYAAKIVQQWQNFQYDLARYRNLGYDVLTQVLIYGTGIAKIFWKYEEKEKYVDMPIFPELPHLGTEPIKMKVPVYDNIGFDLVDVFDFFVDPEATCLEDAEWVAHRTRRTLEYLETMEERGIYKNIVAVKQEMSEEEMGGSSGGTETDQRKQERMSIEGHTTDKNLMLKPIELMEIWKRSDNSVTTIARSKHLIREQDNPYRHGMFPFRVAKIISTPHEFYGIGLIEAGAPSAKIMEDLLNNGLDSLNFSINPMIGIDQTRIEDTELVSRPGGFYHTTGDPRTALFPLTIPDASQGTLVWFQLVNELAKKGTGIVDYLVGQTTQGKTATEASLMTNEAAKRIGMHIKVFGMTFIGPLAEMVHELNNQFTTEMQTMRVTGMPGSPYGDETVTVTPDVFGAGVDFIWESEDREMNNMVAVQQLMQMLGIAQTHPILAQFIPIIFEKVLEKYDMHENEELKQAAIFAKQMAPAYQALVMKQMQAQITASENKGGIGNAPRPAGGGAGNIAASAQTSANPSLGNAPVS